MDFSLRIVNEALVNNDGEKNVISSPLSIAAMLSILAFGSGGHHLQSMLQLLGAETLDDLKSNYSKLAAASSSFSDTCSGEGPILNFVNGAWMNQDYVIKPDFEQVLKSTVNAQIKSLDFEKKVACFFVIALFGSSEYCFFVN